MNRMITLAAIALLALAGCGKKKADDAPADDRAAMAPGPTATAGGAATTAAPSDAGSAADGGLVTTGEVEVPTEMDFEDDAAAKITDKNVEAQVKALEQELARQ